MHELWHKTTGTGQYDHLWLTTNETNSAVFLLKSCTEARILLSNELDQSTDSYQLIIGGNNNRVTAIELIKQGSSTVVRFKETFQILSCDHYRPFWLKWDESSIEAGQGLDVGDRRVISYENYYGTLNIHALGITTSASTSGEWIFPVIYGEYII